MAIRREHCGGHFLGEREEGGRGERGGGEGGRKILDTQTRTRMLV